MMRLLRRRTIRSLPLYLILAFAIACGGTGGGSDDENDDDGGAVAEDDDDGGGTDFGVLMFTGDDVDPGTNGVEDDFDPIVAIPFLAGDTGAVSWSVVAGIVLTLTVDGGEVARVVYQEGVPGSVESFFYDLDCDPFGAPPPAACDDLDLDFAGQSLGFDDVELPVSPFAPDNIATGPLTADGVLTW